MKLKPLSNLKANFADFVNCKLGEKLLKDFFWWLLKALKHEKIEKIKNPYFLFNLNLVLYFGGPGPPADLCPYMIHCTRVISDLALIIYGQIMSKSRFVGFGTKMKFVQMDVFDIPSKLICA